jgi:GTP-binding protein
MGPGEFSRKGVSLNSICGEGRHSAFALVKISSAIFDLSAPDLDFCPDESLPEIALIGRSNAGKSSLLNFLSGKKDLARVSSKPGSTVLINFFTMNERWRLVDLPGYGYARKAREDKAKFNLAVAEYLQQRPNLCRVLALIDSRIPPQAIDLEFIEWLSRNGVPFVLVFTKAEKVSAAKLEELRKVFADHLSEWRAEPPEAVACSAKKGLGRKELLWMISRALTGE